MTKKTLEEVIALLEDERRCDVPHYKDDLLYHLKGYRNLQMGYIRAIADLEDNQPLTWDELKDMEEKPVWIVYPLGNNGYWAFITVYDDEIIGYEKGDEFGTIYSKELMDKTWQAYRKERE